MEELGVWTTAEGTTPAVLQLESDEALPGWASGALQGALTGAATGAAAGPYGALIGLVAGAGLGAAMGATAPAAAAPAPSAAPAAAAAPAPAASPAIAAASPSQVAGDGSNRTKAVLVLQQFAAVMPALVQLVAASGGSGGGGSGTGGGKEFAPGDNGAGRESLLESDWGPEVFQGTWSIP